MEYIDELSSPEQMLCDIATQQKSPITCLMELSPLCNMNCDMCFVRLSPEKMKELGRLRTVDEWLSLAKEMCDAGVLFVQLSGGEPLLYPGFKELYIGLKEMGMIITINTNGTLLDEKWADFFAANPPRRINITLYGSNAETYRKLCHYSDGFERTINAIKLLNERGVSVKINGSLSVENKNSAIEIAKIAKSMDTFCKIDTYMYPVARERDTYNLQSRVSPEDAAKAKVELMRYQTNQEEFVETAKQMLQKVDHPIQYTENCVLCRAGRSSFTINWQGEMRPCALLSTPSIPVFELGFAEAWKKLTDEVAEIRLSSKCMSCNLRAFCQTCAASAIAETGSFEGTPDYLCRYTKKTVELLREALLEEE